MLVLVLWGLGGSQLMPVLIGYTQVFPDVRAVSCISYFEYHSYLFPQSPSPTPTLPQVDATIPQTFRLFLLSLVPFSYFCIFILDVHRNRRGPTETLNGPHAHTDVPTPGEQERKHGSTGGNSPGEECQVSGTLSARWGWGTALKWPRAKLEPW